MRKSRLWYNVYFVRLTDPQGPRDFHTYTRYNILQSKHILGRARAEHFRENDLRLWAWFMEIVERNKFDLEDGRPAE